jgi:hypothetical protein
MCIALEEMGVPVEVQFLHTDSQIRRASGNQRIIWTCMLGRKVSAILMMNAQTKFIG